jgi:hypothetical protein
VLFNLAAVVPVVQVNPYFGSVFVFDSRDRLARFVTDNADLYHARPEAWQFARRKYLYYEILNELLYDYFQEKKQIPTLSCRPVLVDWATGFFRKNAAALVPVTVQVRNNPFFDRHRNLRADCWIEFFRRCRERYPVKFFLIGTPGEIDARFREMDNVLVAKDFHTGIEQDLALIQTSAIHMGASSGPACMALFSSKPYLLVSHTIQPGSHRGLIEEGDFVRFFFSTPYQRLASGAETPDLLMSEFERMWPAADTKFWLEGGVGAQESKPLSWLR